MAGAEPEESVSRPIVRQRWRNVGFLHWRVDPEILAGPLPDELEPDLVDGSAWISLTPFAVEGFRALGLPALPFISTFNETNLRTYVRHRDGRDGLLFLSLDVDSASNAVGGRAVGAPYHLARMSVREDRDVVRYRCRRLVGSARHDITLEPSGEPTVTDPTAALLTGRWRAFVPSPAGLVTVAVEHQPWPLTSATVTDLDHTMFEAAGLPQPSAPTLVHWSRGVDARLGSPRAAR